MTLEGEYEPSSAQWVRDQVETYERTGGREANTLLDTGWPIVLVTTRGNKSGKVRKTPLMRVEHNGEYALVASQGGAPKHPVWYYNLKADPTAVELQDGPEPFTAVAARSAATSAPSGRAARGRRVPAVRGVPGADDARDPGLRRVARLIFTRVGSRPRPSARRSEYPEPLRPARAVTTRGRRANELRSRCGGRSRRWACVR